MFKFKSVSPGLCYCISFLMFIFTRFEGILSVHCLIFIMFHCADWLRTCEIYDFSE